LKSCFVTGPGEACCGRDNNIGWRYTLLTVGAITMGVFVLRFFAFRFHESPKFLIYRGKDEAAVTVIQKVSKFNKHNCNLTLEMLQGLQEDDTSVGPATPILGAGKSQLKASWTEKIRLEGDRYKNLFSNFTMTRLTLLIWITYMCDFWGFTIAGLFVFLSPSQSSANHIKLII
jgi:hypothetical protein